MINPIIIYMIERIQDEEEASILNKQKNIKRPSRITYFPSEDIKAKSHTPRAIEFLLKYMHKPVEIDITLVVRVIEFLSEKYKNLTKYVKNLKNNQNNH